MGAAFDCDGLVDDVAFDTRGRGQTDFQTAYTAHDTSIDNHIISGDFALDCRGFTDGQQMGADVALNGAFNLNITRCLEVAGDVQVRRQN